MGIFVEYSGQQRPKQLKSFSNRMENQAPPRHYYDLSLNVRVLIGLAPKSKQMC